MSTLLLLFQFKPDQVEQIRKLVPGWTIVTDETGKMTREQLADAEIVCGWNSSMEEALSSDCKLKWVQTSSAGIDKLPLAQLQRLAVHVTSASGIHPVSMAETLFGMLLAFSRNLHHAIRHQSQRQWKPSERYHQLTGRTMGIIGVGAIGAEFARLAGAFGMRTLGVRRSALPVPCVDKMYDMEHLDEVLSQSDVVVNVLPYTAETHHLFNAERFQQMKPNALFFNMGRGASVDTDAMVRALEEGPLGGAGLDVFEAEPLPGDHPLWTMDNVIITPHIGGWTDHYKQRVADIFLHNLQAYVATGKPDRNVVDYERSY
ncbi:D-2-hydroxyacid dehydrogenase [Cohnella sp. NL03-T5]|uniref:D-2-hydroxyacid dehydrogenase n=2 Tax=Cohnella silvisoli TaxID=2873699 RepID=A0ABV1KPL4_9BACL|nr:D-2-hydroxyacid dehydrogenase [Cohnella silvisoli]